MLPDIIIPWFHQNGVEASTITEAVSSSDFATKFVEAMAENGQPGLTAEVMVVRPPTPQCTANTVLAKLANFTGSLLLILWTLPASFEIIQCEDHL
jgi:hypothetical protein